MNNFYQKSLISLIFILAVFFSMQAQDSPPKLRGVQVGFPGLWLYKESKVAHSFYIRNELGIERLVGSKNSGCDQRNMPFEPVLSFVPKWYYNMNSRNEKSKDVSDLAGNFFSINARVNLNPNFLQGERYVNTINQLSIIPTWGMRRNINKYFNYELSAGYGYFSSETYSIICAQSRRSGGILDIQARIGFKF